MSAETNAVHTAIFEAVEALHGAGLAVIPVRPGEKRPLVQWKDLQGRLPTEDTLLEWFRPDQLEAGVGVGAIMGRVSGDLELTELEGRAMARWPEVRAAMKLAGLGELLSRLENGWTELSPSGGYHFLYRLEVPAGEHFPGNTKVAQRPAGEDDGGRPIVEVLAETRGEGGFVVLAPTDGSHHSTGRAWCRVSGGPAAFATLTLEDRNDFHRVLHEVLDEMPERVAVKADRTDAGERLEVYGSGKSPVEHFNEEADWADVLEPHGWTYAYTKADGTRYWWRPGKDRGEISATTDRPNEDGASRLFIFSTSTDLPVEEPLTKAFVLAHYAHGGDMSAASSWLRREGWGDPLERPAVFTDPELDALAHLSPGGRAAGDLTSLNRLESVQTERSGLRTPEERAHDRPELRPEAPSASRSAQEEPEGREDLLDLSGLPTAPTEPGSGTSEDDEEKEPAPSWGRLDLSAVLDGTWTSPEATLMAREDGACLLYPGMVHSFQGESESGKSFLAQAETARVLTDGGRVLYLDFESDQGTVVSRMLALGAPVDAIRERLDYRRPEVSPIVNGAETAEWLDMLATPTDLAVIDGVTEAFAVFGVSSVDNDEVTAWGRNVPRKIAAKTGAAVVVIDHVTKATEGRGRFAIGAQAKMSYLTGASYTVEVKSPLGVGMVGVLSLRVGKDRPGRVRPVSGEYRSSDRSQEAAQAVIDSTEPGRTDYELRRPEGPLGGTVTGEEEEAQWVPSVLMERVSRALEEVGPAGLGARALKAAVSGKTDMKFLALEVLEAEGYVRRDNDRAPYRSVRPYREVDDPRSGKKAPELDLEELPGGLRDGGSNMNGRP